MVYNAYIIVSVIQFVANIFWDIRFWHQCLALVQRSASFEASESSVCVILRLFGMAASDETMQHLVSDIPDSLRICEMTFEGPLLRSSCNMRAIMDQRLHLAPYHQGGYEHVPKITEHHPEDRMEIKPARKAESTPQHLRMPWRHVTLSEHPLPSITSTSWLMSASRLCTTGASASWPCSICERSPGRVRQRASCLISRPAISSIILWWWDGRHPWLWNSAASRWLHLSSHKHGRAYWSIQRGIRMNIRWSGRRTSERWEASLIW